MANVAKHAFVSAKSDGADATLVQPGDWNDPHLFTGGETGDVLLRDSTEPDGARFISLGLQNLTYNSDFEVWGAGASAAPTGWTLSGAGATIAKDTTNFKHGTASVGVTRVGNDAKLSQNMAAIKDFAPAAYWQGRKLVVGCWVRATVANRARIGIDDGVGSSVSASHSGDSSLQFLQVTRTIDAAATKVEVFVEVHTGNTTAQFDALILTEGTYVRAWVPSSWRGRKSAIMTGTNVQLSQNTTYVMGPWGSSISGFVEWTFPFRGVARKLRALVDSDVGGTGQTVIFTLRKALSDTALTCTVNSGARDAEDVTNEVLFEPTITQRADMKAAFSATTGSRAPHATFEYEEVPEGI